MPTRRAFVISSLFAIGILLTTRFFAHALVCAEPGRGGSQGNAGSFSARSDLRHCPCAFAYMAPILAVVFSQASDRLWYGTSLLLAYGLGHCMVIVLAGTFTEIVQRYLDWDERSRGALILKKVCGLLVIAGGAWLVYSTHA